MAQFQAKNAKVIEMNVSVPQKRNTTVSLPWLVVLFFLIFFQMAKRANQLCTFLSLLGGIISTNHPVFLTTCAVRSFFAARRQSFGHQ